MKVYFVGAGPGDPELLTIKGRKVLEEADTIIYAGSLVNPDILSFAKEGAEIFDSSKMTLEEIIEVIKRSIREGKKVVRLHSGDLSIYSALQEQINACEKEGIDYELIPGVSSFQAASSALKRELTLPDVSQTVIITRIGGRTSVLESQDLEVLAKSKATIVLFLSVHEIEKVVSKLKRAGLSDGTPCAVIQRVTWPDQKILTGTLKDISEKVKLHGITKHALIIVGDVLRPTYGRSKLYDPQFEHGRRKKSEPRNHSYK
ncbi:MAG: precorrin-4 C(11)-methyltransferase [Desulfobacterota bacterium]|nr:precorrin-4 C(11)-methyltransferase [Thermodesulfobacteriota bacterium]MDW8001280.1 precorrin-4 C(11)-methyltransferase [Deltaproteobacteria bacterium]